MESAQVQTNAHVKKALKLLQTALKVQLSLSKFYIKRCCAYWRFYCRQMYSKNCQKFIRRLLSNIFSGKWESECLYIEMHTILKKVAVAK